MGQEFHVSHPSRTEGTNRRENERWKAARDREKELTEVRGREISALGISETSLARVTPRPFRRKFNFMGSRWYLAASELVYVNDSFVCASNERTDGARRTCTYERYDVPR